MSDDNVFWEVGSHFPFVGLVIFTFKVGDDRLAWRIMHLLVNSISYHMCLSSNLCLVPLYLGEIFDHISVWQFTFWMFFSLLGFPDKILRGCAYGFLILSMLFSPYLPISSIFPLTLVSTFITVLFIRWRVFPNTKSPRMCPILSSLAVLLAGIGMWFQYSVASIHDDEYAKRHPPWHVFILLSGVCGVLAKHYNLVDILHLDGKYIQLMSRWHAYMNRDKISVHR